MDKFVHHDLTIFRDNCIELYDVNYNPEELYRFILSVKSKYRIRRDFTFDVKTLTEDYNVAKGAEVDKVLKWEFTPKTEGGYEVSGIGILKSRFERIIGMRGNLKGQEIYFEKFVGTLPALSMYLKEPTGGEDILPLDKKIELVNQYVDIHNFDFKGKYDQFYDQDEFLKAYIGDIGDADSESLFDISKGRAVDNIDFINAIDKKGGKILQKLR